MPVKERRSKNDPDLDYADDLQNDSHDESAAQKIADLTSEVARLTAAGKALMQERERLQAQPAPVSHKTGVFLLIVAFIIAGRLILFKTVEDSGGKAALEAQISNVVFGCAALVMLGVWIDQEWKTIKWLMVPNVIIVAVTLVICASSISDGALLEGVVDGPAVNVTRVCLGAILALLVAASPLCIWLMRWVVQFLNDPVAVLKKLKGESNEK